ncbi:glycerol-3-phosphate responsive antiterminator [Evansella cellulosilytica]|uniref:Glycerol uptake operon antiterminator regulatory protein n=1 Tax=Evansella cellulosilytica (strain ATCC 21833 / DSM 2522 / FERM P-1141 / JCM 9156 / N-4) TaxID=649639 RepID=E6TU08_EVAC2|nr:glycerol-3-phosphate responsive antiterminator [Evansella cellulosilytica]ADU32039.1 glycerol-3-phosphate responsive antiterminator, GlpP [Evansella cellulosilytica DSM 2522]
MTLLHMIGKKPIIAALRSPEDVSMAINSPVDNIFFMGGSINEIIDAVRLAKAANKGAFIHVDLVRGLSSTDVETIAFISNHVKADGIVTPKKHLIREAKKVNLYGVLHLFTLDSVALSNGFKSIKSAEPDAIELMPGVIPKTIEFFSNELEEIPIIASGLVQTEDEVRASLEAGATSLSVSAKHLWNLQFQDIYV